MSAGVCLPSATTLHSARASVSIPLLTGEQAALLAKYGSLSVIHLNADSTDLSIQMHCGDYQMKTRQNVLNTPLRWFKRGVKYLLLLILVYVAILLIGLVPVNNGFTQSPDGVKIYIVSNAVHADIIVPKVNDAIDWQNSFSGHTFSGDISSETHVAFGWGDRGFFLETETWDDLKLSTALNALLLPSDSCVHVSFTRPERYSNATSISISQEEYEQLVEFIDSSFELDPNGKRVQIAGYAYSTNDAFFCARGRYHLLNTCNSWVGRALKTSGVCTPWLSPMPKSPTIYIKQ